MYRLAWKFYLIVCPDHKDSEESLLSWSNSYKRMPWNISFSHVFMNLGSQTKSASVIATKIRNQHLVNNCGRDGIIYTEQMDAEDLGDKLQLTLLATPGQPAKSRLWVLWQHFTECSPCKHLQVLSMPALQREAAWTEERFLGDLRQSVASIYTL